MKGLNSNIARLAGLAFKSRVLAGGLLKTAIIGICFCVSGWLSAAPLINGVDACNVVWDSHGTNAAGSTPIGNGEVGLNVRVEPDGDLLFYVARSDSWSKCCRRFKLHGPKSTVVEGSYQNGKLMELNTSPKSRRKDVRVMVPE